MPATPTTRLQIPLPAQSDPADVPTDLGKLANKLDPIAAVFNQGTLSARPTAGTQGRIFYATDTSLLYYDDGTAWNTIGPYTAPAPVAVPVFKAYRQTALNIGPTTYTLVPVDFLDFDTAGGYGTGPSAGMYKFPTTGYYQVNGRISVTMNQTASAFVAELWVNSASACRLGSVPGQGLGTASIAGSALLHVNAGDTVQLTAYHNVASTNLAIFTGRPYTALEVAKVA